MDRNDNGARPHRPRRRGRSFASWIAVAGLTALLFGVGLDSLPLMDPDEGRYAEIAREMLATGDFVTPHLNGVVYLEKPPLYFWLEAAAITLLGPHEIGYRICSVLFGVAGLALAGLLGRAMGSPRAGLLAATALATSPLYALFARMNVIDMTLSFLLSACLTCFWLAENRPTGRAVRLLHLGAFAGAALAVLTKGLIGVVIPGAVIALYLIVTGRVATLRRVPWRTGVLLFFVIALPWHLVAAARNPGFVDFYLVGEHLKRFATPVAGHEGPIWFYLPVLAGGMLPWTGLLPAAMARLRDASPAARPSPTVPAPPARRRRLREEILFLWLWAGVILVFFTLSRSKLIPYVLPACLPLAVLCALVLDRLIETRRSALPGPGGGSSIDAIAAAGMATSSLATAAPAVVMIGVVLGWLPLYLPSGIDDPFVLCLAVATLILSLLTVSAWMRRRPDAGYGMGIASAACLIGSLVALAPHLVGYRSTREFAAAAAERLPEGAQLVSYGFYAQSLPVYLRRYLDVANYTGELAQGIARLTPVEQARRFPTEAQFGALWRSESTVYVVVDDRNWKRMREAGFDAGTELVRRHRLSLLINAPEAAVLPDAAVHPSGMQVSTGEKDSG